MIFSHENTISFQALPQPSNQTILKNIKKSKDSSIQSRKTDKKVKLAEGAFDSKLKEAL
jgi:hypothetical protein